MPGIVTFPAGDLEKFVLSANRKQLLQIERDEDTKHDDEDLDAPIATPLLSSLYGSTQHTKYHLQQIENNITSILIKYNGLESISDDDTKAIQSLLNEAQAVLRKTNDNDNDLDVLHLRHKLRALFLSPYLQMEQGGDTGDEEQNIYEILIDKLGLDFNYSKPSDVGVGAGNDENEQKISDTWTAFDVNAEMKQQFAQCKGEGDITQRFNKSAMPWILEQDFTVCPEAIADLSSYSKHVLSITDKTELAIAWMKQNASILFKDICRRFSFTKEQLHRLGQTLPKLWSNEPFLSLVMEKSLPTSVSFYLSRFNHQESQQTFQDFLPRELAMNCYDILLRFAMTDEGAKLSSMRKASVLLHWMQFRLKHYKEYDLEVFMEYMRIPKKSEYNAEMRHDVITRYIKGKQDNEEDTKQSDEDNISQKAYQEDETYKHAFDITTGNDSGEEHVIQLLDGRWSMRYTPSKEYSLIRQYALHYMDTEQWNTAIQNEEKNATRRINSNWFREWIQSVQNKPMEDALTEFMDTRFLQILRLQYLLWNGDGDKKPNEYMDELKTLCHDAPLITRHAKAIYAREDIVRDMQQDIIFEFDATKNKEKYSLKEEAIDLALNVKNLFRDGAKEILVQIFEMNTLSYYRDKRTEFDITMNLDGLNSKYLHSIPVIGAINPFEIRCYTVSFPKELLHKRGVYIIDCILSGYQTRAMIKIGDIKYMERITSAGHCFSFFDEENQVISARDTACNIFMDGHMYKPELENSNKIFIPFSTNDENPPKQQAIIIQREDDPNFNVLSHFSHSSEKYHFVGDVYMDREQLLEKQRVQLMIRSALYVCNIHNRNQCRIPLKLVQNVKAEVNITTAHDVDIDKTFDDLQLTNDKETVVSFTVPRKMRSIKVKITGFIKRIHSTKVGEEGKRFVSLDKTFTVNDIENGNKFASFHLNSCQNGDYIVSLLGKNGESIPNIVCDLALTHHYFKKEFKTVLKTDPNGRIYLPNLCRNNHHQFKGLAISARNENAKSIIEANEWRFDECYEEYNHATDDVYYMAEGSTIHIALHGNIDTNSGSKRTDYALFDSFYAARYEQDAVSFTQDGYLQIANLKHGEYVLTSLNADVPDITIVVSPATSKRDGEQKEKEEEERPSQKKSVLSLYNQYYMQLSPPKPLQISRISGSRLEGFRVELKGVTSCTRVHAILTHFYPRFSVLQYIQTMQHPSLMNGYFDGTHSCQYTNKRRISEEYRYCLDRKTYKKFYGNSLITPSFLVKPLERGDTRTGIQRAKDAEPMYARLEAASGAPRSKKKNHHFLKSMRNKLMCFKNKPHKPARIAYRKHFDSSNLDFLKISSKVMSNVQVNSDGTVMIGDIDPLYNTLHIIAVDEADVRYQSYSFYDGIKDIKRNQYRDNRQPISEESIGNIDKVTLKQENRCIVLLNKGEPHKVDDFKSCEIQTYDTMQDLYSLLTALSKGNELESKLNKWSFITQWNSMDHNQKLLKYDEYFCHELNFFLFVKDPVFFQKIALPWIAGKLRKDVMDYFLLNDVTHLRTYTQKHLFETLNPLEKILLAYALKDEALRNKTVKYFQNQQQLLRVTPQKLDKLFRTALAEKQLAESAFTEDVNTLDGKDAAAPGGGGGGFGLINGVPPSDGAMWGGGGGGGDSMESGIALAGLITQVERSMPRGDALSDVVAKSGSMMAVSASFQKKARKKKRSSLLSNLRGGSLLKKKRLKSDHIEYSIDDEECEEERGFNPLIYGFSSYGAQESIMECAMDMAEEEEDMFVMRDKMDQAQLYQEIESTKEYQETYWYHVKYEEETRDLIPLTKFWCEYGQYLLGDDKKNKTDHDLTFLSKWILLATTSIHDIICALTVLNLAFQNDGPQYDYEENRLRLTAVHGGSIVFIKQLAVEKEQETATQNQETISVHVSYFDPLDAYEYGADGEMYDKFIAPNDTFYTLKVYRCVIVLTNVSSMQQNLKLLVEIPSGSIPCGKDSYFNKTHFITVSSYSTEKLHFHFYFPEEEGTEEDTNRFYSFPIIVSKHRNNQIVSWTKAQKLNVISSVRIQQDDIKSNHQDSVTSMWNRWKKVSVSGHYDEIFAFLSSPQCNLCDKYVMKEALPRIYYLFQRKDSMPFWQKVVQLLWNDHLLCDDVIWSFALWYKAADKINVTSLFQYLLRQEAFANTYLAPYFYISNELCTKYRTLPYFEYIPLINSRVHALGSTSKQIMNYNLRSQYTTFLKILSYQSLDLFTYFEGNRDGQMILSLIYYLLVQGRIDDALLFYKHFMDRYDINRNKEALQTSNVNIDYLKCYLLLFAEENQIENMETIMNISKPYLSKESASLVPKAKLKWFYNLNQLLSKQDGEPETAKQDSGDGLESKQCSLSFTVDKGKKQLIIHSHLVKKCNIHFYGMNTELLFSIDPFTLAAAAGDNNNNKNAFHYISPGVSMSDIDLTNDSNTIMDIPRALMNKNVFIVVESCDADIDAVNAVSCSDTFYDDALIIQIKERYGQIKVVSKTDHRPIKKAYVKVFAEMSNGRKEFYKDGYTDVRGGFDYVSVSSGQLQKTQKFAILIVTKEYGCAVKYAKKPKI